MILLFFLKKKKKLGCVRFKWRWKA
jgi:hypothetical protein